MIATMTIRSHPGHGLLADNDWQSVADQFGLSRREQQVAKLLFQGANRELIALSLKKPDGSTLSPETVRVYVDRLYQKLNVADGVGMTLRILLAIDRFRDALSNSPQS